MNDTLRRMVELTEIDHRLVEIRDQLQRYPATLAEMDRHEARQQAAVDAARQKAEGATGSLRNAEKEVQTLRDKIRHYLSAQSSVKTAKEFEALTHEIDRTNALIDTQETLGLEKLEEGDAARRALAEAETRLHALKEENQQERARIAERMEEKQRQLGRLEDERTQALAGLDPAAGEDYLMAHERHPGSACAPVKGSSCGACGWELTAGVRQAAHKSVVLTRCESCRRFLYDPQVLHP